MVKNVAHKIYYFLNIDENEKNTLEMNLLSQSCDAFD